MTKYTNAEIRAHRRKGLEALRSNRYKQDEGALRTKDGYCCLGVLTEVSQLGEWRDDPGLFVYVIGVEQEDKFALPPLVTAWYGLVQQDPVLVGSDTCGRLASVYNDGYGYNLKQIADLFEAHFRSDKIGLDAKGEDQC